ncbi:hypothetical protein DNTS_029155 [Danionella cerebrum]|uniref:Protein FAM180A-like n=1 Tax=Danionella cerebrum TaxID=2873325 RepID=A0A553RKQ1_9TELE|nr:hypothetical protein DNTS_029155 [Danionella translucida]
MSWRTASVWIVFVSALVCQISITVSLRWRRGAALFPSAFRVKRGTPSLINPLFQKNVEDASLLYEVLLSGGRMDSSEGALHISDPELSSLRRLQILDVLCSDVLPRSLSEITRLVKALEKQRGSLCLEDFERTVLTLVFTAQRLKEMESSQQRELWSNASLSLFKAVRGDLRPQHTLKNRR